MVSTLSAFFFGILIGLIFGTLWMISEVAHYKSKAERYKALAKDLEGDVEYWKEKYLG